MSTREIEDILYYEIQNWIRWGKMRDMRPKGFSCPLSYLYRTPGGSFGLKCNEREAMEFERIVVALPPKHRKAFVLHHLEKTAVNNRMIYVLGRDRKASMLGVHKSQYYVLVSQAHLMILREWERYIGSSLREGEENESSNCQVADVEK